MVSSARPTSFADIHFDFSLLLHCPSPPRLREPHPVRSKNAILTTWYSPTAPTTKKGVPVVHAPVPTTKKVVVPVGITAVPVTVAPKKTIATIVKAPGTTTTVHTTEEPCDEETTVHRPAA